MKHVHVFEVIAQVGALVGSQNTQGKGQKCPQVRRFPFVIVNLTQIVNLGMAVMTRRDAVIRAGIQDLFRLYLP